MSLKGKSVKHWQSVNVVLWIYAAPCSRCVFSWLLLVHSRGYQCAISCSQHPSWPKIAKGAIMQTEREAEEYVKKTDFVIFLIITMERKAVTRILHCAFCVYRRKVIFTLWLNSQTEMVIMQVVNQKRQCNLSH